MENAQSCTAEVLEGGYTPKELRIILAHRRGARVPPRTLRYWRNQLGMVPNRYGLYEESDLAILERLICWLSRGRSIKQFKAILQEELNNAYR